MPDYSDILKYLAQNPPKIEAERRVHASLLELLGACLRDESPGPTIIEMDGLKARNDALMQSYFQ